MYTYKMLNTKINILVTIVIHLDIKYDTAR